MGDGYVPKRLFAIATSGNALGGKIPAALDALLDPAIDRDEVGPLWREFRACYPSEDDAVSAASRNLQVILPFVNIPSNIEGSWRVLCSKFSDAEALQIVSEHPGILANKPGELDQCSQDDIRRTVTMVTKIATIPPGVRAAIPPATAVTIVALIAKRLVECAGATCG